MHDAPERLDTKIRIRPIEPDDSLAHLTGLLHRAYKQHADRGLKALAAFQPEEVTRRRISDGHCDVAAYLGKVVGTIMFKDPAQTAAAYAGCPWFDPAANIDVRDADGVSIAQPPLTDDQRRAVAGSVASFSQFAVEPEHQGKGVGGRLMAHVEQRAAAIGARELALSTPEPAEWLVAMYLRHGYRPVARYHWPYTNYVSVIMSKTIT